MLVRITFRYSSKYLVPFLASATSDSFAYHHTMIGNFVDPSVYFGGKKPPTHVTADSSCQLHPAGPNAMPSHGMLHATLRFCFLPTQLGSDKSHACCGIISTLSCFCINNITLQLQSCQTLLMFAIMKF